MSEPSRRIELPVSWLRLYQTALERWKAAEARRWAARASAGQGPAEREAYERAEAAFDRAEADLHRIEREATNELLWTFRKLAEGDSMIGRAFAAMIDGRLAKLLERGDRVDELERKVEQLGDAIVRLELRGASR